MMNVLTNGSVKWLVAVRGRCFACAIAVLLLPSCLLAAAQPAKIFSDHMVLQRGLPVEIWGTANSGEKVAITFDGQEVNTIAKNDGRWRVTLKSMKASSVGRALVVQSGEHKVVIRDVVVGEVWFAGGQSNMDYKVGGMAKRLPEGKAMLASAKFNAIRFRKINERDSPVPLNEFKGSGQWQVCSPQSASRFSAVGFVVARRLHLELKVPVGVIDCSWGGTPIEPYIPAKAFVGHPTLEKLAAYAKAGDVKSIKSMRGGTYVRSNAWLAGAIYNGRITPVAGYGIRGALWYQAESNCGRGEDPRDYAHKMRALVKGWRAAWKRKDLPVYYVQLPQWKSYAWTYARQEQLRASDVAGTGMAVTIDLDNANDIHPPNKIDVGERLARWPLAKVYGRDVAASGPIYKSAKVRGVSMIISFDHIVGGLLIGDVKDGGKGIGDVKESKAGRLHGFELVGDDGVWHEAKAVVSGETLVVTCMQVPKPLAVRYACHPVAQKDKPWNLYNKAGLPASPFCSDWTKMVYQPSKNPG